ncbi:cobalamin biosynthesis protein CobW [Aureimonas jatrophae]|uniref:Cobalamin biosynthesis protein CobW n=1 Tax=Aureimonas jatrophae TaxID=1166073 RepID=A0A1H0D6W1_9HYPH|nr:cobalamin biosynthesis protein CobW [Aureimonas jatrophae]MBB3951737.1 cobalamin biosynthesis protein CobW [Aureimonas jatrophae]SDN65927.1 cobalamin biosynthesis protein CobW [Aureimonas jatrophae]
MRKIPATVVTGFLGAGKTTLIRHLLENAGGRRIALVINEFGDLGVDGDLLKGCGVETCREEDVVELTNGCICCTVADDFIPTMEKLIERADRLDHIVIETSGLALPQPLVAAFNWPEVKARVTVDGVVTVIDAAAVRAGRFAHDEDKLAEQRASDASLDHDDPLEELFEDQIRAADLLVLNKCDLLDAAAIAAVRATIADSSGDRLPAIVEASQGRLPADVLLGLGAGTEDLIASRRSHHEIEHEGGEPHDHDDFESFVAEFGAIRDLAAFEAALRDTIRRHDILRVKGFASVEGKPMRLVVQAVGERIATYYDRRLTPGEDGRSALVVIGLHDRIEDGEAAIADALRAAAGIPAAQAAE